MILLEGFKIVFFLVPIPVPAAWAAEDSSDSDAELNKFACNGTALKLECPEGQLLKVTR